MGGEDPAAFAARAAELRSGAFLGAARLASPGATLVDTGNAPFVSGVWAFSLNGIVSGAGWMPLPTKSGAY